MNTQRNETLNINFNFKQVCKFFWQSNNMLFEIFGRKQVSRIIVFIFVLLLNNNILKAFSATIGDYYQKFNESNSYQCQEELPVLLFRITESFDCSCSRSLCDWCNHFYFNVSEKQKLYR